MSSIAMREGLKGEKTLRFVYCVLNIILALGTILSSFSIWGLVWSAVVIAIVFAGVATDDKEKPVCSYLCRFFLMQCLVYVLVHWDVWVDAWDANAFASLAVLMRNNNVVFLLEFVGTITFLSGFFCKKHNITWLFGLGCGLIGLGVLLPLWSIGVPLVFVTYAENGGFVLALYTLFVLCWTACMYVVTHVWPSSRGECLLLTLLLFAAALSIAVFCNKYVHTIAGDLKRFLLSLPNDLFLWWHVVLVLVVLIVLFVLVGEYRNAMSEEDRSFLLLCANYTLAIRLLMSFYFTYSWILFLLFAILGLHSLSNEATDKKTFCMACDTFLAIEMVAFIPLMLMFCFGLWANVLVTIVNSGLSPRVDGGPHNVGAASLRALHRRRLAIDPLH